MHKIFLLRDIPVGIVYIFCLNDLFPFGIQRKFLVLVVVNDHAEGLPFLIPEIFRFPVVNMVCMYHLSRLKKAVVVVCTTALPVESPGVVVPGVLGYMTYLAVIGVGIIVLLAHPGGVGRRCKSEQNRGIQFDRFLGRDQPCCH